MFHEISTRVNDVDDGVDLVDLSSGTTHSADPLLELLLTGASDFAVIRRCFNVWYASYSSITMFSSTSSSSSRILIGTFRRSYISLEGIAIPSRDDNVSCGERVRVCHFFPIFLKTHLTLTSKNIQF